MLLGRIPMLQTDGLLRMEDKYTRVHAKQKNLKSKVSELEDENIKLLQEKERECELKLQLMSELQFFRESQNDKVMSSGGERIEQLERVKELQLREIELQQELEDFQKRTAAEKCKSAQKIKSCEDQIAMLQDQLQQQGPIEERIRKLTEELHVANKCIVEMKIGPKSNKAPSTEDLNSTKQLNAAKILARQTKKDFERLLQKHSVLQSQLNDMQQGQKNNASAPLSTIDALQQTLSDKTTECMEVGRQCQRAKEDLQNAQTRIKSLEQMAEKERLNYLKKLDDLKTADPVEKDGEIQTEQNETWEQEQKRLKARIHAYEAEVHTLKATVDGTTRSYDTVLVHAHVLRDRYLHFGFQYPELPPLFTTDVAETKKKAEGKDSTLDKANSSKAAPEAVEPQSKSEAQPQQDEAKLDEPHEEAKSDLIHSSSDEVSCSEEDDQNPTDSEDDEDSA